MKDHIRLENQNHVQKPVNQQRHGHLGVHGHRAQQHAQDLQHLLMERELEPEHVKIPVGRTSVLVPALTHNNVEKHVMLKVFTFY